jgi:hypothetical protein
MKPLLVMLRVFAASLLVAIAGCSGIMPGDSEGPPVAAPEYRVGDRWEYRAQDGFRLPVVWQEVREVVAAGPDAIRMRVTQSGGQNTSRMEQFAAPGLLNVGAVFDNETRRFAQPLKRFAFPLTPGESWNQWVTNVNEQTNRQGDINRFVRVGGWRQIPTPAGTFNAIRLTVMMRLDDEEFWRWPTTCTYTIWYAPAVRGVVRADKEAQYLEKGDPLDGAAVFRSQHATLELVRFTAGGS